MSFRSTNSKFKHVLTGAPLLPRSDASDAGSWSGVAFTSAYPCRSLAVAWPPDIYETSRIQLSSFYTPASWISGAVVSGYPEGRTHPNARPRTERLLDFALDRLLLQPGPRFMAGDWNFPVEALNVCVTVAGLRSKTCVFLGLAARLSILAKAPLGTTICGSRQNLPLDFWISMWILRLLPTTLSLWLLLPAAVHTSSALSGRAPNLFHGPRCLSCLKVCRFVPRMIPLGSMLTYGNAKKPKPSRTWLRNGCLAWRDEQLRPNPDVSLAAKRL